MVKNESDLFLPVKTFFEEKGYDVYSEVVLPGGGRADVVAYMEPVATVIELKKQLSMELIEQALDRRRSFPYVYVCVPERKKPLYRFVEKILRDAGIGVLEYTSGGYIRMKKAARFKRSLGFQARKWNEILRPEHKTWLEGGASGGGYVTDYRLTMERVKSYLRIKGSEWTTIDDILNHCETHYAAPKPSLSQALRKFEDAWCESKVEGRKLHFRYKREEPERYEYGGD